MTYPSLFTQAQVSDRSVIVTIPPDTEFYVGKDRIVRERVAIEVDSRLKVLAQVDHVVFIKASQSVQYGTIVRLIDDIRARGYERIGLIADKKNTDGGNIQDKPPNMLTSQRQESGVEPKMNQQPDFDAVAVSIQSVRAGYAITVDGVRVTQDKVQAEIRRQMQSRHLRTVIILSPPNVPYSAVTGLIDAAKDSGAEMVSLQVNELAPAPRKKPR